MNEQFWKNAPKLFADNADIAVMRGIGNTFLLALCSGANAQVFAFTPEHMKRFSQLLAHHMSEYEKVEGSINVKAWAPGIESPFTIDEIKGEDDPSREKK